MKKRIYIFGALGLTVLCCGGAVLVGWMVWGKDLCREHLEMAAVSPDDRYIARSYMQSCYMDSIPTVSVVIATTPKDSTDAQSPGHVTLLSIGASRYRAGLLVNWLDAETLQIDYTGSELFNGSSGNIRNRLTEWRDVRILYRGLCED
jgi:hypothetical protein